MKLTDTQLVVLSAACQREDRNVLPLPANLKGGAAQKVIAGLLARGLAEERAASPNDLVWRTDDESRRFKLLATDAAFQALGIEVQSEAAVADHAQEIRPAKSKRRGTPAATAGGTARSGKAGRTASRRTAPEQARVTREPRSTTKQAQLIAMLKQPDGASLDEIVAATGWQAHTVRGAIAGALKKKLGLTVTSERVENRGRLYRIAD